MLLEAAAALLLIGQPTPDPPEVAKAALREAEQYYRSCMLESAERVDDGRSDEATIAKKIEGDCPSHFAVYFRDLKEVHPDETRTEDALRHTFALEAVRTRRAPVTVVD
jgi:hypothetical protein